MHIFQHPITLRLASVLIFIANMFITCFILIGHLQVDSWSYKVGPTGQWKKVQ
jgi:hypothetical protein